MKLIFRRLRGALGNALVWGTVWFAAGFVLITGYSLLGPRSTTLSWELLSYALRGAAWIAMYGAVVGGAFSAYIAANFRNSRLQDLSPGRFALGGGLVTLVFVLAISLWSSLSSDWPFFLKDLIEPVLTFGSIGVVTGYSSIKLAQRALPDAPAAAELEASSQALVQ